MQRFLRYFAWGGWLVLMLLVCAVCIAPGIAQRHLWWAAKETFSLDRPLAPWRLVDGTWAAPSAFIRPAAYFPEGAFGETHIDTSEPFSLTKQTSELLTRLEEPSIYGGGRDAIRLLCCRSFQPVVCVRIYEREDGTWGCSSKRLDEPGMLGQVSDTPLLHRDVTIHHSVAEEGKRQLHVMSFWKMVNERGGGIDGSSWILEAKISGNYQVIEKYCPEPAGPIYKLGNWMMKRGRVADGPIY